MTTKTTRFRQGNIDPQRWDRLKTILGEALEQNSSAARIALVERRCGQDTDLLEEAESLLAEAEALLNERYRQLRRLRPERSLHFLAGGTAARRTARGRVCHRP